MPRVHVVSSNKLVVPMKRKKDFCGILSNARPKHRETTCPVCSIVVDGVPFPPTLQELCYHTICWVLLSFLIVLANYYEDEDDPVPAEYGRSRSIVLIKLIFDFNIYYTAGVLLYYFLVDIVRN